MHDPIILERLELILEHTSIIAERMKRVPDANYFNGSEESQILYDSILIRLQAIGENIKKIEKITPGFTESILGVDASKIIRFRGIIVEN